MRALRFGIPFLFLATAPVGVLVGGDWTWLTPASMPLIMIAFGWMLGLESGEASEIGWVHYRALPWLYIAAQIAVIAGGAIVISSHLLSPLAAVGLTISVGLTAGVFGIVAAHEMVHSRLGAENALGLSLLACLGYMHFAIAHLHGHHVRGATFEDPASARRGESVYHFVVRSVSGQFAEAWAFEAKRLRRRGLPAFGLDNRVLRYLVIELAILAGLALLGFDALAYWIGQGFVAVLMLELFNYIAHYGLQRARRSNGRYEPMAAHHSWNSARRMNNWALFNMGRHSDHHRRPTQAYQRLVAEAEAPQLPAGYAEAIILALAPRLWRRVMDPRVDAWMGAASAAGAAS